MSPQEVDEVRHLFTMTEPDDEGVDRVISLVRRNGGIEYAREKAVAYADVAEGELRDLCPGPALDALRDAVLYVTDRSL